jgi:tetratricopeptide (TPR) repeat protein
VVARRTREALARFGADPDAVPVDEAVARVNASEVRPRIVSALDRLLRQEKKAGVRALLRRVDADAYRDAVRDAVLAKDGAKLVRLAGTEQALKQPPGFAAFLGELGEIKAERRRQVLQAAVSRQPGDLGLLMTMATTYLAGMGTGVLFYREKDSADELVRWFQAAVAAAPTNSTAYIGLGAVLHEQGKLDEAITCWRKAVELSPENADAHTNLGVALRTVGRLDEAIASFEKAVALNPKFSPYHFNLAQALRAKGQMDRAIASYRKTIDYNPKRIEAYSDLGLALVARGKVDEAIAWLRKAIKLAPKFAAAHINLGVALNEKGKVDEAIACYRKAIALAPKFAQAHYNLGTLLYARGKVDEAITSYRKAIALDPKNANAHYDLGVMQTARGKVDAAIACYQKALALDPQLAKAHTNLGVALQGKGQVDEAIACYRKAIALDPKNAKAHTNLGWALSGKGKVDEAIACFRKAIALDPKHAIAHYNPGNALMDKGNVDEAVACYKKAIEIDPNYAEAHCNLGDGLRSQGRFAESLAAFKRGHELGSKRPGWPWPSAERVREAERMAAAEGKLPAFLKGAYQPRDAGERLDLAGVCRAKKLHAAAARLSAAAFTADPKLAGDLQAGHRYAAACSAALAAAGHGGDAAGPDKEKARLCKQALDWLRADLALRARQLETGEPTDRAAVQKALRHWQTDADLAGIRDAAALAQLPAGERKSFTQLWAGVAALLKRAEGKTR